MMKKCMGKTSQPGKFVNSSPCIASKLTGVCISSFLIMEASGRKKPSAHTCSSWWHQGKSQPNLYRDDAGDQEVVVGSNAISSWLMNFSNTGPRLYERMIT